MLDSLKSSINTSLMRNFAKLFASSVAAKAIGFLAMPIIARLVSPANFGEFSIFSAVISVVAPLLALRYVDAIPISKSTSRATQLLTFVLILIFVNATFLLVLGVFLLKFIVSIYPFINVQFLLLLYCVAVALATFEALNLWAVRTGNYSVIARTQISQALAGAISKVTFSYFSLPMGLMLGQFVQNITGISSLLKMPNAPFQRYNLKMVFRLFKNSASRYSQYPKYRLASQVLLVISQALPVLAVGKIYGQSEAGQLGLAFSVITVPVMIVVNNMRKLYYGEAIKISSSKNKLRKFTIDVMLKMACVSLPGCVLMFFFAEYAFVTVLGEEWRLAGKIAEIYSIYIFSLFFSGAVIDLFNIINKQALFLVTNFLRLIGVVFVLILSAGEPVLTVLTRYSMFMFIFYIYLAVLPVFFLNVSNND